MVAAGNQVAVAAAVAAKTQVVAPKAVLVIAEVAVAAKAQAEKVDI